MLPEGIIENEKMMENWMTHRRRLTFRVWSFVEGGGQYQRGVRWQGKWGILLDGVAVGNRILGAPAEAP